MKLVTMNDRKSRVRSITPSLRAMKVLTRTTLTPSRTVDSLRRDTELVKEHVR